MTIDWSISISTMIHLLSVLVGGALAYANLRAKMENHSEKLEKIDQDIVQLRDDVLRRLEDRLRSVEIRLGDFHRSK